MLNSTHNTLEPCGGVGSGTLQRALLLIPRGDMHQSCRFTDGRRGVGEIDDRMIKAQESSVASVVSVLSGLSVQLPRPMAVGSVGWGEQDARTCRQQHRLRPYCK